MVNLGKFKDSKLLQFENIEFILITLDIFIEVKSIVSKELQLLKILFIFVTEEVLKCDIFKDISEVQLLNISSISVTFEVSKLLKLIEFKELHPLNIPLVLLTKEELKFEKSIYNKESQDKNISLQSSINFSQYISILTSPSYLDKLIELFEFKSNNESFTYIKVGWGTKSLFNIVISLSFALLIIIVILFIRII